MEMQVRRGDVIWVRFDPAIGCELRKRRPAVVLSADRYNGNPHNAILVVVPLKSGSGNGESRHDEVVIPAQESGLYSDSVTVSNQIRAIDRIRVEASGGHLSERTMRAIEGCVRNQLSLR